MLIIKVLLYTASQCKDLRIIFIPILSWSPHIDMIVTKAYKILGLIRRTFHTNCSYHYKLKLYLSLVRSQLMYCSQLWRSYPIKDIHDLILERVQCRATKYILNNYSSDYISRLTNLNLLPLMYLYELNDIIFYQILSDTLPTF